MKRVWVELKDSVISLNDKTNTIKTINNDGLETNYNIKEGLYTRKELVNEVSKSVNAKLGIIKSDKNKELLVMFFDDSIVYVHGSLINFLNGIDLIDSTKIQNGAETRVVFYVPSDVVSIDVTRNPQWTITKSLDGSFSYTYDNNGEIKEGKLDNIEGNLYGFNDILKSNHNAKYEFNFKNNAGNSILKSGMSVMTNSGELQNIIAKQNVRGALDVDSKGNTVYLSNNSLWLREKITGNIKELKTGVNANDIFHTVGFCKHGENKDKLIYFVENTTVADEYK